MRTGGSGTVTSLFVRGGESNYNKVLLDGIPLNEPGGVFNFSNITTREPRARGARPRRAVGALRLGRDGERHAAVHAARRARRRPRAAARSRPAATAPSAARPPSRESAAALDYSAGRRRLRTDNRVPNNEFENTTLSGSAGVALGAGADAPLRRRAASSARSARPGRRRSAAPTWTRSSSGTTASAGVTFTQQLAERFQHRATYASRDVEPGSRPTCWPIRPTRRVRGPHRAVRVLRLHVSTAAPSCAGITPAIRPTGG